MRGIARTLKVALLMTGVVVATAVAPGAASAGLLVQTAQSCADEQLSQPFTPWLDYASYTQVPGGAFEPGQQAWNLTGGAKVVSGNETYRVRSASDGRSLYIPQGATATSPSICVGLNEPTLRYFARQSSSLLGITGAIKVDVLFEDSLGSVVSAPIGLAALSTTWQPSLPAVVTANLLPLLPGQMTAVAFRFTALTGSWQIDDAYVDPMFR